MLVYGVYFVSLCKGCYGVGLFGGYIFGMLLSWFDVVNFILYVSGLVGWSEVDLCCVLCEGIFWDGCKLKIDFMLVCEICYFSDEEIGVLYVYFQSVLVRLCGGC